MGRFSLTLISLLSTVALARLLLPEDFGVVAVAMTTVAFFDIMSAFGFDMYLIKEPNPSLDSYNTAFTMNALRGAVLAVLMLFLSQFALDAFEDPRCVIVFYVISLTQLIEGFKNIGIVDFRKNLQFEKEFKFNLVSKLSAFFVTMLAAFYLRDYRALILGIATATFVRFFMSYVLSSFRPRFCLAAWRPMMHFSKWLLLNNVFLFLNDRAVTLILGSTTNVSAAGLYRVSSEIGRMPTTEAVWPLTRVLFPGFAKIAGERNRLSFAYVNSLSVLVLIGIPMGLGLAAVAEPVVLVFLGSEWTQAIPLVTYIAAFGTLSLLCAGASGLYLALGVPQTQTKILAASAIFRIPLLYYAIETNGIVGAALAMGIADLMLLLGNWHATSTLIDLKTRRLMMSCWRPLVGSATMFCGVTEVDLYLVSSYPDLGNFSRLAFLVSFGAILYICMVWFLWRLSGKPMGPENKVLEISLALVDSYRRTKLS